jgi:drug/metabolite transporter (DMT)-like permease
LFPIWVALLSWPVLRIAPTRDVWVATAAGVCGVWLIQQPHFEEQNQIAALAPLAGSLFSALAMLGLHRLQEIDARAIVVHFSFVTLAFAIAAFFVFERSVSPGAALDGKLLATLAVMGVAATVGQFFLTKAFTTGHPAKVSVVGLTQVGIGMAFDVLIWHRSFRAPTLLGVVLVVAPTAWLLWRRR